MEISHAAVFQTPKITTFLCHPKTHHPHGGRSFKLHQSLRWQKGRGSAINCGGGGVGDRETRSEIKRKDEMNAEELWDEEESNQDIINEKVELMEMEAIMGKDDGREAMDYKRRAGIFYKSSEMFQANKEDNHHHPHHCT